MTTSRRLRIAALAAVGFLSASSGAYYDDVHYSLTYYIARQSGYSPAQAWRIASACSMVDWDEQTEPVQSGGQLRTMLTGDSALLERAERIVRSKGYKWMLHLKPLPLASAPRARFHAFRDETKMKESVGNGDNGMVAQGAVRNQLDFLFEEAKTKTKNPGVFLHAFQDEMPHRSYGTVWGHNPFTPDSFALHQQYGLPVGSTTDWVSFRSFDVLNLCATTNYYLTQFMGAVSPHQYPRPHYDPEYQQLVADLARINPHPAPISSDLQRQLFVRYYARSMGVNIDPVTLSLVDSEDLQRVSAELGIHSEADFLKHKDGPNLSKAQDAVNAALARAGMTDKVPQHHIRYDLDEFGVLDDPAQLDKWVLVGSLTLKMRGSTTPVTARLRYEIRDASGQVREVDMLNIKPASLKAGVPYTWHNLPIGDVIVEIQRQNGTKMKHRFVLAKQKNEFGLFVPNVAVDKNAKPVTAKPVTKKPTKPTTPAEEIANFTGTFTPSQGRYGYPTEVTLSQSGANVTGSWTHASGGGTINGTVKGRVLTFKFTADGVEGTGTWTLATDGKSINGAYSIPNVIANNRWGGPKKG